MTVQVFTQNYRNVCLVVIGVFIGCMFMEMKHQNGYTMYQLTSLPGDQSEDTIASSDISFQNSTLAPDQDDSLHDDILTPSQRHDVTAARLEHIARTVRDDRVDCAAVIAGDSAAMEYAR